VTACEVSERHSGSAADAFIRQPAAVPGAILKPQPILRFFVTPSIISSPKARNCSRMS